MNNLLSEGDIAFDLEKRIFVEKKIITGRDKHDAKGSRTMVAP